LVSRLVAAHAAEEKQNGLALVAQDLRPGCTAAADHLQATADAKEQRIVLSLPPWPVSAAIDHDTFVQVMENLLGNALKFSPRGAAAELSLIVSEGACRIEVSDKGPGVPEEEREKLFQKFHRGSAQPTGGETSTGLGLFIVQKLIEAMNGSVSHASREGGGSVFIVTLPGVG
jgi:two-component system sensor histidine kinase/response regulator